MLKTRLFTLVTDAKKYIAVNVILQWIGLVSSMVMVFTIAGLLDNLRTGEAVSLWQSGGIILLTAVVRMGCTKGAATASYYSSRSVKRTLRGKIYEKLLCLGSSYTNHVPTAEVVQLAGEGVEQLETYFGSYLPQFFYALLAPLTLFAVVSRISMKVAVVLLVCVPLIPVAIVVVQKIAKRLLAGYWGQYAKLGDSFLENLQGLTTLKIYQADEQRHQEMREEAEHFRVVTMKVLSMQLNSIIVMDLVAYGGAALGILLAVLELAAGHIEFAGCLCIILLSADFFLPMRQLGSFFHVAMNGMAASDKIFRLLDLPEDVEKVVIPHGSAIECRDLHFGYTQDKETLHGVNITFPKGSFTALVGASGCGKSTIASILMGRSKGYAGSVTIGGCELSTVSEAALMQTITLVSHNSYLFKGTVRDNLLMGKPDAEDAVLWQALEQVRLADFIRANGGLDMALTEGASNLSGGQRQRLAIARALLHDTPVYIFDEATSNIDVESENDIMTLVHQLAHTKTIILISHRLANVTEADNFIVLQQGNVAQTGTHAELLASGGAYKALWDGQQALESITRGGDRE